MNIVIRHYTRVILDRKLIITPVIVTINPIVWIAIKINAIPVNKVYVWDKRYHHYYSNMGWAS